MRTAFRWFVAILAAAGLLVAAPAAGAHWGHHKRLTPMIFLHGGAGSGGAVRVAGAALHEQRVSAALHPRGRIRLDLRRRHARGRVRPARRRDRRPEEADGRPKVDLLGHSLGTTLSHEYLASPARAANIAHYVNIDGRTADLASRRRSHACDLGRARAPRAGRIEGADERDDPEPDARAGGHVRGDLRAHLQVLHRPQAGEGHRARARITLSGRAALFPQNVGVGERTLEIWAVHGATGQRKGRHPVATLDIADDGSWGPVRGLSSGKHYEFALVDPGQITHHIYFEPFKRSSHLVRLLTSEPGGGVNILIERSPSHSALTIVRYKELWGDQGAENDSARVNGTNVINAATAPITKRVIGMFAFDTGSDGVSNVATPHPVFFALPFLSGVDLFIPAAAPPAGTVVGGAQVAGGGARSDGELPELRVVHGRGVGEPRRLRAGLAAPALAAPGAQSKTVPLRVTVRPSLSASTTLSFCSPGPRGRSGSARPCRPREAGHAPAAQQHAPADHLPAERLGEHEAERAGDAAAPAARAEAAADRHRQLHVDPRRLSVPVARWPAQMAEPATSWSV